MNKDLSDEELDHVAGAGDVVQEVPDVDTAVVGVAPAVAMGNLYTPLSESVESLENANPSDLE